METLYSRLGIDPSATQDDVKRAYRKLAVVLHPDKGGDEDAFAEIVEAYEILCDDRRREIYDVVGLDGLRMYAALASMHSSSDTLPPLAVVASGAVLGVTAVVLLLSFVAMAAAKHDGRAESVPWLLVFLPCLATTPLVGALLAVRAAEPSLRDALLRVAPSVALLLAFEVLLCLRLERDDHDDTALYATPSSAAADADPLSDPLSWLAVLTPLLIGRGLAIAELPGRLRSRQRRRATMPARVADSAADGPLGATLRELGWLLLSTLQLTLLPPRLGGLLHVRWATLLAPTWLALALEGVATAASCCGADRAATPAAQTPNETLRSLLRQSRRLARLIGLLALGLLLRWAAAALDAAEAGRAPSLGLVSPLVLSLGALLCGPACAACALRRARRRKPPPPPPPPEDLALRSTKDEPPTSEEARVARELTAAAFENHPAGTPLPGDMPA